MRRETTASMNAGTDEGDLTTGNAVWETPAAVFEKLNEDFGPFDVDLTADPARALCQVWFGPGSPFGKDAFDVLTANALGMDQSVGDWSAFSVHNGYSNPPYGPFVQKLLPLAKANARHCGFTSTLLLPMRVTWSFKAHILGGASELLFCDSRITFFENGAPRLNEKRFIEGKLTPDPAMFDSIIVRYVPGHPEGDYPKLGVWTVPTHVTKADLDRAAAMRRKVA